MPDQLLKALHRAHFATVKAELELIGHEALVLDDCQLPQEWVDEWWIQFAADNWMVY